MLKEAVASKSDSKSQSTQTDNNDVKRKRDSSGDDDDNEEEAIVKKQKVNENIDISISGPINIVINSNGGSESRSQKTKKGDKALHNSKYENEEDDDLEDEDEDEDEYEDDDEEKEEEYEEIDIEATAGNDIKVSLMELGNKLGLLSNALNDQNVKELISKERGLPEDKKLITTFIQSLSSANEMKYFKTLTDDKKQMFAETFKRIESFNDESTPLKFKILAQNFDDAVKSIAYKKMKNLVAMSPHNGEYHKLKHWIDALCNIPFGKFKELPVKASDGREKITQFMQSTKEQFDKHIFGHEEAKDHISRIVAQWISNPASKGNVIGIHGKPGVGKTTLIKDGLAKALHLPFAFVPLGGAHDASFLDGHGYTYEGSTWGKVTELLMSSRYMNPVIYFDELDKISDTTRGQEIINVLIHLTDPSQNDKFCDKYFSEIPFDLSKALIVFTYNDDSMVNPILKDRMIRIETKPYSLTDKIQISRRHILPEIMKQFNIGEEDILIEDAIIKKLVIETESEAGVRNLKRNFESIISNINLNVLLGKDQYPVKVDSEIVKMYKKKVAEVNISLPHMYL